MGVFEVLTNNVRGRIMGKRARKTKRMSPNNALNIRRKTFKWVEGVMLAIRVITINQDKE